MINCEAAEKWLRQNGRPVDQAIVHFEKTGKSNLLMSALAEYVNHDGGFGKALEPDIRLSDSSVIATTVGLQLMSTCRLDASEPMIRAAMSYLDATYDRDAATWAIIPPNIDDAAHAPWWIPKAMSEYLLNPRAEIVGYMYRWPGFFPSRLRADLTDQIFSLVKDKETIEMHDLLVVDRLICSPNFPLDAYKETVKVFYSLAESVIAKNPEEWREYGLTPLMVVKNTSHPLANTLRPAILRNLAYLVDTQEPDGSWAPSWSWFGNYADDWPEAERDIRSFVTADSLCTSLRFDNHMW